MKHSLNIDHQYLDNLLSGKKKSEIRINDRDYQLGDELEFYDAYSGDYKIFEITHIHSGLGLQPNYVVLSVRLKP